MKSKPSNRRPFQLLAATILALCALPVAAATVEYHLTIAEKAVNFTGKPRTAIAVTPRAGCGFGVAYGKVSPGNLQIDNRLAVRLVPGLKKLLRFIPVLYAKRFLFPREVVLNPINRTTEEHPKLFLYAHNFSLRA